MDSALEKGSCTMKRAISLPLALVVLWATPAGAQAPGPPAHSPAPVPVPVKAAAPAREAPAAPFSPFPAYDVRAFGARGDGRTLDTDAIERALSAAAAAGGGTVYFGAGSYPSYSIRLRSNITLYLDQGATLIAADTALGGRYDLPEPNTFDRYQDFGHSHWHNSLIWGEGVHDVAIVGPGRIWGRGLSRGTPGDPGPGMGNKAIALKASHNVLIRDISILHGGHFAILLTGADNTTIDNVKIDTNRDGIDVDASRGVHITNTSVNSPWDDAIVLKASYGLGELRATREVTISNCYVSGGYVEGTLLDGTYVPLPDSVRAGRTGRVKFGTESNGDFTNITIDNIVFDRSQGLALESVDGAHLEDVTISNLTMREVRNAPIFLRLGSRMRAPPGMQVGTLRRVHISHVVAYGSPPRYASVISGIPGHPVEDVRLNDIQLVYTGGAPPEQAAVEPPERENAYPEPTMFGAIPAYGFYIRHASGIELNEVSVRYENEDARPPFILEDVVGADLFHVKAEHAAGVPTVVLKNVRDLTAAYSSIPDVRVTSAGKRMF
jgi:polygalacturonase